MVDGDAVVGCGPGVAVSRSTPVTDQVARGIKLENVWCRNTAIGFNRICGGADLGALIKCVATMDDVDVVTGINADTDR